MKAAQDETGRVQESAQLESEEMRSFDDDLRQRKAAAELRIREIEEQRKSCKKGLAKIGKDIAVCDQMDAELQAKLKEEQDKNKKHAQRDGSASKRSDTLIQDIKLFKDSN